MSCQSFKVELFSALWAAPRSPVGLFCTPYVLWAGLATSPLNPLFVIFTTAAIGRRLSLIAFALVFCVGAVLTTVAGPGIKGLNEIYIGGSTEKPQILSLSNKCLMPPAGRVISGLGIGGISAIAPMYVSECAPKDVRGRITGLFQVFVAIGVMISYWTNCKLLLGPCVPLIPECSQYICLRCRWRPETRRRGPADLANPFRNTTGAGWFDGHWVRLWALRCADLNHIRIDFVLRANPRGGL